MVVSRTTKQHPTHRKCDKRPGSCRFGVWGRCWRESYRGTFLQLFCHFFTDHNTSDSATHGSQASGMFIDASILALCVSVTSLVVGQPCCVYGLVLLIMSNNMVTPNLQAIKLSSYATTSVRQLGRRIRLQIGAHRLCTLWRC